jgi:hypothetical protein
MLIDTDRRRAQRMGAGLDEAAAVRLARERVELLSP